MSILQFDRERLSPAISRRYFIAAGAAVVGTQTFASGSKPLSSNRYSALIIGTEAVANSTAAAWRSQPVIRELQHTQGVQDSLQAIRAYRPELIAFTDPTTSAALLDYARPLGLCGVCLDLSTASAHGLAHRNRSSFGDQLKWAVMDPLCYSEACTRLAQLLESELLGRLLEIRCDIQIPTTKSLLPCCRQSIALAVGWGGLPRSCHTRIYQGTTPLNDASLNGLKESGLSARDCSLHASMALASGLTFNLDCRCDTSRENATSEFTFLGTRGVAKLSDEPRPNVRWRAAAADSTSHSESTWHSLSTDDRPSGCLRSSDCTAAVAVLQDLICSIELERKPLLSLSDIYAANAWLNSSLNAHRLQQRIYFSKD